MTHQELCSSRALRYPPLDAEALMELLFWASKNKVVSLVESLITHSELQKDHRINEAIVKACEVSDNREVVRVLLSHPLADPLVQNGTAFRHAVEDDDGRTFELLLGFAQRRASTIPLDLLLWCVRHRGPNVSRAMKENYRLIPGYFEAIQMIRETNDRV